MTAILFAVESAESRSLPLNAQRLVNFFTEKEPQGAKSQTPLFGAPGMSAFADTSTITGAIAGLGAFTGGFGYVSGVFTGVPLTGGSGSGALATITISGAAVSAVVITTQGVNYKVGDVISALSANIGGTGSGFSATVAALAGGQIASLGTVTSGTGYGGPGHYDNVPLTGGTGTGATANMTMINVGDFSIWRRRRRHRITRDWLFSRRRSLGLQRKSRRFWFGFFHPSCDDCWERDSNARLPHWWIRLYRRSEPL